MAIAGNEPVSAGSIAAYLDVTPSGALTGDEPISVDNLKAVFESNKSLESSFWSGSTNTGENRNYQQFDYQLGSAASGISGYYESATAITVKSHGRYRLFVGCMNTSTMAFGNCAYSISASVSGGGTYSLGGYGVVPALKMVLHSTVIDVPADSTRVDIKLTRTQGQFTNVGLLHVAIQRVM